MLTIPAAPFGLPKTPTPGSNDHHGMNRQLFRNSLNAHYKHQKCLNVLDGRYYMIKEIKLSATNRTLQELSVAIETKAHEILGQHPNIHRCHSIWLEDEYFYYQYDYCSGGSLQEWIHMRRNGIPLDEPMLKSALKQLATGLAYIHSKKMAHTKIEPASILINFAEVEGSAVFKIGKLNAVRFIEREKKGVKRHPVEDDIGSLALTICQMGWNGIINPTPQQFFNVDGKLIYTGAYSLELHQILEAMLNKDPFLRPSSLSVARHPFLNS